MPNETTIWRQLKDLQARVVALEKQIGKDQEVA